MLVASSRKTVPWIVQVARLSKYGDLDPNGMTFDAVVVFGLAFHILFKSFSAYYETIFFTVGQNSF